MPWKKTRLPFTAVSVYLLSKLPCFYSGAVDVEHTVHGPSSVYFMEKGIISSKRVTNPKLKHDFATKRLWRIAT